MMRSVAVVLVVTLLSASGRADASANPAWKAIRPQNGVAAALYARALDHSATVRALSARIRESDVIVYLEVRRDLPSGIAARLVWMSATASHRIVRISIRQGLRQADGIGFVAHELQHAVEVVEHPDVRSSADLEQLYRRIGERGRPNEPHWDTNEAVAVERVARMEALGHRTSSARRSG